MLHAPLRTDQPRTAQSTEASAPGLGTLAVLIPAWQPDERLLVVARAVSEAGFAHVVVVDDGSSPACGAVFAGVAAIERVILLRHATNRGKGQALKTGFQYLRDLGTGIGGVVTADADGQHLPEDIARVGHALLGSASPAVLGVRSFAGAIPFRSRLGNLLTQQMFAVLTGIRVADTQTGLRGLHHGLLPGLIALPGERYEYELSMLAHLCRGEQRPEEVGVATVYLDNNRSSHFDPLWDSLSIYRVLLRLAWRRAAGPRTMREGRVGIIGPRSSRREGKLPNQSPVATR